MSKNAELKILFDHFHRVREERSPSFQKVSKRELGGKEESLVKILIIWTNISGIDSEYKQYYSLI